MSETVRRQRLRFRSWHRGTREMDLLLGRFADQYLGSLDTEQLDQYEALLLCNDPDLYNWITNAEPIPAQDDTPVLQLLAAFCLHTLSGTEGLGLPNSA